MRRSMMTLTAVFFGLTAACGMANALPCDNTERGTYVSNVCFLVDEFNIKGLAFKIALADEESCTVTLTEPLWNMFGTYGATIYFNRANSNELKIESDKHVTCWHLAGEGINGEGFDKVSLCGSTIEASRLENAFSNLYDKYCEGHMSEF